MLDNEQVVRHGIPPIFFNKHSFNFIHSLHKLAVYEYIMNMLNYSVIVSLTRQLYRKQQHVFLLNVNDILLTLSYEETEYNKHYIPKYFHTISTE